MELTAKLVQVLPAVTGMGKNGEWKKQNIIVETDGMYPKKVCISIWGDKANPAILKVGNSLNISFDIESREYNNNWYTDIRAWKVEPAQTNDNAPISDFSSADDPTPAEPIDFSGDNGDDLPF